MLLLVIAFATSQMNPARAAPDDALMNAVIIAVAPAQMPALMSVAAGKAEPAGDQATQSLEHLQRLLDVSHEALLALLRILDRPDIRPEQSAELLVRSAAQYHSIMARLADMGPPDADDQRLVADVQASMAAGTFSRAEALLWQIETRATAQANRSAGSTTEHAAPVGQAPFGAAQAYELLGELTLMKLRYGEAADLFQRAAALLPVNDLDDRLRILTRRGDSLAQRGSHYGDMTAFQAAVEVYREVLGEWPEQRIPHEWAATENKLGLALYALGEQEPGTTSLEAAIAAYRSALAEDTREDQPLEWAAIQNNLGDALLRLGNRQGGTAQLEEAVLAYRTALDERTRERVPLDWAATQNKLGQALDSLGERGGGPASLHQAADAFRAALEERTRDRSPRDWAATQRNLGTVLSAIGQTEEDATPLQAATSAYRAALEVISRDETPFQWGATQFDLASALFQLGGRPEDRGCLIEALDRFEQAKAVFVEAKLDDLANSVTPVIASVKQTIAAPPHAEQVLTTPQADDTPLHRVAAEHRSEAATVGRPASLASASLAPAIVPDLLAAIRPTAEPAPPLPQLDLGAPQTSASVPMAPRVAAAPGILLPEPAGVSAEGHGLSPDMLALLLSRGDALLAIGDVSSARLFYLRAAAEGDARAAAKAGRTLDPLFLAQIGARGIHADAAAAAAWYRRAIELGDQSVAERLKRMSQTTDR